MSVIDEKLIESYTVLVLAEEMTKYEVPEKYRVEVEIRVAKKTIEVLGDV